MKAAFYLGNKRFETRENDPQAPGPEEVRLEVAYCGICGTDIHIYQGHMDRRVPMPHIIGHEMSGRIVELGEQVSGWQVGERVTVRPLDPQGDCPAIRAGYAHIAHNLKVLGVDTPGAMQQSWTVPAHTLHRLPDKVSLKHAAFIEPVAVACHDVRLGRVQAGETVVVIGGGPIGMLIALVAREAGANVVLSEINPHRVALARELGFTAVDPQETDLVALIEEQTGAAGADVVFEVSGSQAGATMMTKLPRARGRIVVVAIYADPPQVDLFRFFWREIELRGARVYEPEDFEQAIDLVAKGRLPLDRLTSTVRKIDELPSIFQDIEAGENIMKAMVDVQGS